jgi:hypothetical protein
MYIFSMEPRKSAFEEYAQAKERSRQEDERALLEGKAPAELRIENAHFARLRVRRVREKSPAI